MPPTRAGARQGGEQGLPQSSPRRASQRAGAVTTMRIARSANPQGGLGEAACRQCMPASAVLGCRRAPLDRRPRWLAFAGVAEPGRAASCARGSRSAGAQSTFSTCERSTCRCTTPRTRSRSAAASVLIEACYSADGLLWSSPMYQGTISGALKNALDWLHPLGRRDPPFLHDKVIGLISAAGGTQGLQAINTMEFAVRALRGWAVPYVVPVAPRRACSTRRAGSRTRRSNASCDARRRGRARRGSLPRRSVAPSRGRVRGGDGEGRDRELTGIRQVALSQPSSPCAHGTAVRRSKMRSSSSSPVKTPTVSLSG